MRKNKNDIASLPISAIVFMSIVCGSVMAGFRCCADYCNEHHEEWEKERFEKYMEGYRARMAGCTGINWNR